MLFCLSSHQVFAQESTKDIVYLNDGTILHGCILEFNPKSKIKVEIEGGNIVTYKSSRILKIEKAKSTVITEKTKKKRELQIDKEKGWYHSFAGGNVFSIYISSLRSDEMLENSKLLVEYTFGYQFNQYFSVGANIGWTGGLNQVSFTQVCANFRGYFLKTPTKLFYDLNVGYGMSVNELIGSSDMFGGLHLHPAIGVRFPSTRKGNFIISLGCMLQYHFVVGPTIRFGATF